jgi:hypothetical protein
MSPYETAARWHLEHCPETPFRDILEAHLFCGHVISGPQAFVLGRRVWRGWQPKLLLNPWCTALDGDCWHVWLWAGEVKDWRAVVPFPLPFISFHRGERLRVHRFPAGK